MQRLTVSEFINKVGFQVNKQDIKAVNDAISGIKSTAVKLLGAIGIGFSLSQLRQISEEFNGINDSINYTYKELSDTKEAQQKILQAANATKSSYGSMAEVVTKLTQLNEDMFPIDDATTFATVVQQLVIASGKSESEAVSTQNMLSRAFQSSIVDAGTLTRLQRQAPALYKEIANAIGVSTEKLQEMAKNGQLTSQMVKDAIISSKDAAQQAFDGLDYSISDAMTNIRNQWGFFVDDFNSTLGITQTIAKGMVKAFSKVMDVLREGKEKLLAFADKVGGVDKLLKILAFSAAGLLIAFNFNKIMSGIKTVTSLLHGLSLKTAVIIGVIVLLALLVEDFVNFMQGNNSLIGSFLEKAGIDVEEVRGQFRDFWKSLKDVIGTVKELGKELGSKLASTLGMILTKIMTKIVELLPKIIALLDPIAELIGEVLSAGLDILAEIISVVIELVGEIIAAGSEILAAILPPIIRLLKTVVPIIRNIAKQILPALSSVIQRIIPIVTRIISSILPAVIDLVSDVIPILMQIVDAVLPAILGLLDTLLPVIGQFVDQLLPVILDLISTVVPLLAQMVDSILPVIVELIEALLPSITTIIEAVLPVIIELLETIIPVATTIIEAILPVVIELIETLTPIITNIIEAVLPVILELLDLLSPLLQTLIDTLLPPLMELIDGIMPILQPVIDLVADLVKNLLPLIEPLLNAISPALEAVSKVLGPIFDILEPIVDLIATVVGWIADGLGWVVDLVFGTDVDSVDVSGYAKGTESSDDTFIAGEEGPELITGQKGKKVFTAAATRNIAATLAALYGGRFPTGSSVANLTNISQGRNIVQNVEFNNSFSGEKAIQKYAASTMDKSAGDVTAQLARGLAYAK